MELTRMFSELMRTESDWTEMCDGRKTSSSKKFSQSLDTLLSSDLRVVLLMPEFLVFSESMSLDNGRV